MAGPIKRIVRTAIAPLLDDARASATQVSQLLHCHEAEVIETREAWVRLRGFDGYEGWCHEGYLRPVVPPKSPYAPDLTETGLRSGWSSEQRMSLGSIVRRPNGYTFILPLGALLETDDAVAGGIVMNGRGRSRYFGTSGVTLVQRTGELFTGTSYQWGGVTPWGADCSGMVQTMFALHGIQLPRDAWQQGEQGTPVTDLSTVRPGDLFFFSDREDGRVTHVAIAIDSTHVVHCSLANGGYGVNRLDDSDPVGKTLKETFRFARRIW